MRNNHYTMLARNAIKSALSTVSKDANVGLGVSGGADSLALLIALSTLYKGDRASQVHVVSIDHQLQEITSQISQQVATLANNFGFTTHIIPIDIPETGNGAEADARTARYSAFDTIITDHNLEAFLIGHTKSDQAEQVMLGLLRGSGTRSISGIPERRGVFVRPFLNVLNRAETQKVCNENLVTYWCDPHNDSTDYNRVNIRKLIKETETVTGQNIVEPLVRTAKISTEDADALDFYATVAYDTIVSSDWNIDTLLTVPVAIRKRVYRNKLISLNIATDKVSFDALASIETLISDWHGQKVNNITSNLMVTRVDNRIVFSMK